MKKIALLPLALLITACSSQSDYSPPAGATGEQMFIGACQSCHSSKFELEGDMASAAGIAKKISSGSMAMPSFPDIQGESLVLLSEYVFEHKSVTK